MQQLQTRSFALLMILSLAGLTCRSPASQDGRVIVIQPLGTFSIVQSSAVYWELKKINANTIIRTALPLPAAAYYPLRDRYRADSLIRYLSRYGGSDTVLIGLTDRDISTTKGQIGDWGIMGLGYCPGNACVVSTFRLSKIDRDSQFYKLTVHELGHTQGLPHCKEKTCFMRDAEGGNHLNEEKEFCPACRRFLKEKGWGLRH